MNQPELQCVADQETKNRRLIGDASRVPWHHHPRERGWFRTVLHQMEWLRAGLRAKTLCIPALWIRRLQL